MRNRFNSASSNFLMVSDYVCVDETHRGTRGARLDVGLLAGCVFETAVVVAAAAGPPPLGLLLDELDRHVDGEDDRLQDRYSAQAQEEAQCAAHVAGHGEYLIFLVAGKSQKR